MGCCCAPMKGSDNETRLEGKVVVITGANTGIGKVTALDMSKRGAKVIILCRNQDKAKEAADEISGKTGGLVSYEKLDLASLASVRECTNELLGKEDKIDILINNAGVMNCPNWKTEDGFDMQLGTNHLGHFLLTELLMPLLKESAATGFHPRIVNVSSRAHLFGSMNWDDLNWDKSFSTMKAYCQSKLANVLHAKELARRLENTNISVYSLHPGVINSDLSRHDRCAFCIPYSLGGICIKSVEQGAQTTIYCAVEESIENHSGRYYSDCQETAPSEAAMSEVDAKRLWEVSEKLVGLDKREDGWTGQKNEVAEDNQDGN